MNTPISEKELGEMEAECIAKGRTINGFAFGLLEPVEQEQTSTPAQIYAHYRSLRGEPRLAYLAKHRDVIWQQHLARA